MPKVNEQEFEEPQEQRVQRKFVRSQKCSCCSSTDIYTDYNVGFDIDEEGEEKQHMDICRGCGAKRMWAEKFLHVGEVLRYYFDEFFEKERYDF